MSKNEATQALMPDHVSKVVSDLKGATKQTEAEWSRDQKLANLTTHPGWPIFKKMVEAMAADLRNMVDADFTGNENLSDLGLRFIVARLASDKVMEAVRLPENAYAHFNRKSDDQAPV